MAETWEETKARLKRQGINLSTDVVVIEPPKPPTPKRDDKPKPEVKRFNIHKRTLPIGNPPTDIVCVFGVTKEKAEWWVEFKLKTKCYENGPDDSKTLVYYDVIPVDATPKERSIYYNKKQITIEDVPGFRSPRRIN